MPTTLPPDPAGKQCQIATPQSEKKDFNPLPFSTNICKNHSNTESWVEQRILELGEIFAYGIYAYAIMSNHYHLVVHMSPSSDRVSHTLKATG